MSNHIEIVSVTYRRGKAGERERNAFSDWAIHRPDPDDWPAELPFYDWSNNPVASEYAAEERLGGVWLDLPTDWCGLRFQFFGQFFEHEQSALDWEVMGVGAEDVFGDFVEQLRKIGDELLDERAKQYEPPREVTFLTAWWYTSSRGYEGEWDCDWDLIGRIDLSKIRETIKLSKEKTA
jgi:hypothetical protein